MKGRRQIPIDGGKDLGQAPFAALGNLPTVPVPSSSLAPAVSSRQSYPRRGRVEIRRLTSGRGGKTVTAISGFRGLGAAALSELTGQIRKSCGVGGTVKAGQIEIQGDQRDQVAKILLQAGFQPVLAGG